MIFTRSIARRSVLALLALLAAASLNAQMVYTPYSFTTLAGTPETPGYADETGSAAQFNIPSGVTVDGAGNVYVADSGNYTIRKITPTGVATTLAGLHGVQGYADETGSAARFGYPYGVAVDGAGNVYVGDAGNCAIRKITPGGVVTTLAGGTLGSADGTGSAAQFTYPYGVAVDGSGNVYVADFNNYTIRKVTAGGVVTTVAGAPGVIGSADGTGSAARFYNPCGVAVDRAGNLFVTDSGNGTIRKITVGGVVTTLAGTAGVTGYADGTGSAARFSYPIGVTVDGAGNLYVSDSYYGTIRKVTPGGVVTTLAGSSPVGYADGIGSAAKFNFPHGTAVDGSGYVYVADYNNDAIRKGVIVPPAITTQATGQTVAVGSTVVFSVSAINAGSYQWSLNNVVISGATNARYVVTGATAANAGSYTCAVSNSSGSVTSSDAALTVDTNGADLANPGRLINESVLANIQGPLNLGFVTGGSGTSGTESLLIRATGPALTTLGVPRVMPDPTLTVIQQSNGAMVTSNAGWGTNQAAVTAADNATGAFPLTNSASLDSALVQLFPSLTGGYSVQVQGKSGDSGNTLTEVYDATASYTQATPPGSFALRVILNG